jgi:hypothetical protein
MLASLPLASSPLATQNLSSGIASGYATVTGAGLSLFSANGVAFGVGSVSAVGDFCNDPHLNKLSSGTAKNVVKFSKSVTLLVPINGGVLGSYTLASQPITAYVKQTSNNLAAAQAKTPTTLSRHVC